MSNQEILTTQIMRFWGYLDKFDPNRYVSTKNKKEHKIYLSKKLNKYNMAKEHARALSELADNIYTKNFITKDNFIEFKEWLNNNPDIKTNDMETVIKFVSDYLRSK